MRAFFSTLGSSILTFVFYGFLFCGLGVIIASWWKKKSPSEILSSASENIYNQKCKKKYYSEDDDEDDEDYETQDISKFKKILFIAIFFIIGYAVASWLMIIAIILFIIYKLRRRYSSLDEATKEKYRERINENISQAIYLKELSKHVYTAVKNEQDLNLEEFKLDYMKTSNPIDIFKKDRARDLKFQKSLNEKYRRSGEDIGNLFEEIEETPTINYNIEEQMPSLDFDESDIGIDEDERNEQLCELIDRLQQLETEVENLSPLKDAISFVKKYADKDISVLYGNETNQILSTAKNGKQYIAQIINNYKTEFNEIVQSYNNLRNVLNRSEKLMFEETYNNTVSYYKNIIQENHMYVVNCLNDIINKITANSMKSNTFDNNDNKNKDMERGSSE